VLAEVRAVVQFLQQHEPGALRGGFGHAGFDHRQVGGGIAVVALLDSATGRVCGWSSACDGMQARW
jgi:hypothetical protein